MIPQININYAIIILSLSLPPFHSLWNECLIHTRRHKVLFFPFVLRDCEVKTRFEITRVSAELFKHQQFWLRQKIDFFFKEFFLRTLFDNRVWSWILLLDN